MKKLPSVLFELLNRLPRQNVLLQISLCAVAESCNPDPTAPYCDDCVPCAVTLTLFTGLVQLVLGVLSLGRCRWSKICNF